MNSPSPASCDQPARTCRLRLSALYCVNTNTRRRPEFMQFDSVTSMIRYTAPNGTAGLARSRVSGHSRSPCPPASSTTIAPRMSCIVVVAMALTSLLLHRLVALVVAVRRRYIQMRAILAAVCFISTRRPASRLDGCSLGPAWFPLSGVGLSPNSAHLGNRTLIADLRIVAPQVLASSNRHDDPVSDGDPSKIRARNDG